MKKFGTLNKIQTRRQALDKFTTQLNLCMYNFAISKRAEIISDIQKKHTKKILKG